MAAENPLESLQEEATCPLCLEYFTEPVSLECGHNFCRACISQCWEGSATAASCPQCREIVQQRNLRPNRQLANMVEIAKWLSLQAAKGEGGDGVCGEHQEALKLFCEEDQTPICVICRDSTPFSTLQIKLPESFLFLQEKFQAHLKTLREEREKLLGFKVTGVGKSQEQKIVSEFQELRRFLEEQERLLLAQLEKLDEEIVRLQNENVRKLSEQISRLSELISELEGKGQKPASEFLQVRLREKQRHRLRGCLKLEHPRGKINRCLTPISTQVPRSAPSTSYPSDSLSSVNVTLDPDTAHPQLVLSEDGKNVRCGDTEQELPDNPERFDTWPCVLGCEGFTSGRHCWEVEVGDGRFWAVGVARESVSRKGWISCSPDRGIWAVGWWGNQFRALASPVTPLPLSRVPSRIRVCLDCDRGQVTFIDVDTVGSGGKYSTGDPEISLSSLTHPSLYDLSLWTFYPCRLYDPGGCFPSQLCAASGLSNHREH
uniref:Zinc finger protein RFP-like n=1 Tax=Chelydra serpentina TaxID=8475 RepID=A0A8C3T7J0_CHESE